MAKDKLQTLFARCWKDEKFKKRFMTEPAKVLVEEGFDVPEGVKVRVVENKPGEMNLVLPVNPEAFALSDKEMDQVAGGAQGTFRPGPMRPMPAPTHSQGKECVPW